MVTDILLVLPVLLGVISATTSITLPLHESHVGAPIVLLFLTTGIHLHGIWILGGCLRCRVVSMPFLFCFTLSHALVQNLGGCFQILQLGDGAIRYGQVILELLIEPIVEPGAVVGV